MYRQEGWTKGHYMDNMIKYECHDCGRTFIVGEEMLKDCPPGYPVCPYCGQSNVEWTVWSDEETAERDCDVLGCLGLYIDTEDGDKAYE
jgi:DNA-directed RNA polymerase subunit RPC12/RpoP